ncbi:MAG TPA: peptidoglycan-associated lipoprotein Pal [Nitrospirota bacterium]|nr:peptidoglycan-associated lipoprotein Pal [Nitrospirota bacterium]
MNRRGIIFVVMVCVVSMFVLWGCPKKSEVTSAPQQKETAAPKEEPKAEQAKPAEMPAPKEEVKERAASANEGLQPVYFDFDKAFIRDDAKAVMKANADWLKANPKVKIKIEGNCDERGTKEYNQALGQRRAASAKKYLTDMGVSASRISLISYGKEKPVCTAQTEECWQKNRRDDFAAEK